MRSMPAISGGRPATVMPNTTSSRPVSRPSRIAHAACMNVLSVRPCARACRVSAAVSVSLSDSVTCSGATGTRLRSGGATCVPSSSPAKASCQAAMRGGAVLPGDPRQIVAVGRHTRQRAGVPLVRIEREQLLHQHRHRPAVHQDVMVGQHQPMLVSRKPDQREAHQRRRRQVEALGAVLRQDPGQPLLALGRIEQRQVDAVARALHTCGTMICTGRLRFSCWKPARRLAWRSISACTAACSACASSGPCSASTSCTV